MVAYIVNTKVSYGTDSKYFDDYFAAGEYYTSIRDLGYEASIEEGV